MVRYCLNTVAATITLGLSQPSPLTEMSLQDLEGVAVLAGTTNSRTFLTMVTSSPDGENEESPHFPTLLLLQCGCSIGS
jgi:hypothetical protein